MGKHRPIGPPDTVGRTAVNKGLVQKTSREGSWIRGDPGKKNQQQGNSKTKKLKTQGPNR